MRSAVAGLPRTKIITETGDYLHAECSSRIFGFVDDLELHLRPTSNLLAVRSASRLGYSDLGVNRKRVEELRRLLREQYQLRLRDRKIGCSAGQTMLSYDVTQWGKPLEARERETPEPKGTEVLVRLRYCGVCHSDAHIRDGYFDLGGGKRLDMKGRGTTPPATLGLEPCGTVIAAGQMTGRVVVVV